MSKKRMNFESSDSLKQLIAVMNEASEAMKDKSRIIVNSSIPEVLGAALGAGAGGAISFGAIYALGVVGLSGPGIMSGLAALGGIVGGGAAAGIFVAAAPVAILGVGGYAALNHSKNKKLKKEKERLYQEALRKHDAIINQLNKEANASKERIDYLNSLVILLSRAIKDLREDLKVA